MEENLDKSTLNQNQVILQSRLRVSKSGIEMLDFTIPLGMVELHCSCPIPDEGTEGSPVYVHVKPARRVPTGRPRRRPASSNDDDYQDDGYDENFGNVAR